MAEKVDLITKANAFLAAHQLVSPQEKILVAVSGGIDSMCLLYYLLEKKHKVAVAHCNFQLREEAKADELFVQNFCEKRGIAFFSKSFDTRTFASSRKISIQMAARELRFQWFENIAILKGYQKIALGTHATDQLETMLINQIRGTGISGIHGILPKTGKIIRPFLSVTRADIEAFAKAKNIDFRHDKSNDEDYYLRNDIRLNILPVLKKWNKNIEETFSANATRFLETERYLNQKIEEDLASFCITHSADKMEYEPTILKHPHASLLLIHLLNKKGFNEEQLANLQTSQAHFGFELESNTYCLFVERNSLVIHPKKAKPERFQIEKLPLHLSNPIELTVSVSDWESDTPFPRSHFIELFDLKKLKLPLIVRPWEEGDKMKPLGMKGSKLISDILTDAKVPAHKRKAHLVLESQGKIAWLLGLRASEEFKVDEHSLKVARFDVSKSLYL